MAKGIPRRDDGGNTGGWDLMLKSEQYLAVRSIPESELNDLERADSPKIELLCSLFLEEGEGEDDQDMLSDSFFDCSVLLFWSKEAMAAAEMEL